jgi:hypothetical protein
MAKPRRKDKALDPMEVWVLSFRALKSQPYPSSAIRQILKIALRRFGMKCIYLGEPKPQRGRLCDHDAMYR